MTTFDEKSFFQMTDYNFDQKANLAFVP